MTPRLKPNDTKTKTDKTKTDNKPKNEKKMVFEGEVTGKGKSSYKPKTGNNSSKKPSDYYDPIETTGWVSGNSGTSYKSAVGNTNYITSGSRFISGYLN